MILSISAKNLMVIIRFSHAKGDCPYEYMSSFQKSREELPSKDKFYSSLTGKNVTDKEYESLG